MKIDWEKQGAHDSTYKIEPNFSELLHYLSKKSIPRLPLWTIWGFQE